MTLEGRTGRQPGRGCTGLDAEPEPGDLSVLRILANQAAVSLHTSEQYQAGLALHRRAQQLYDEATAQAHDLERPDRWSCAEVEHAAACWPTSASSSTPSGTGSPASCTTA